LNSVFLIPLAEFACCHRPWVLMMARNRIAAVMTL